LLALIPKNEAQQNVAMTLGDSLCDGESLADMKSLSRVNAGLARQFRKAVALAPHFMSTYVAYSLDAVADPHSDYAVEMKNVCHGQNHCDIFNAGGELLYSGVFRRYEGTGVVPETELKIAQGGGEQWVELENGEILIPESDYERIKKFLNARRTHAAPH
jgi:hypothetical protein